MLCCVMRCARESGDSLVIVVASGRHPKNGASPHRSIDSFVRNEGDERRVWDAHWGGALEQGPGFYAFVS